MLVRLYAGEVILEKITIDDVPRGLRERVKAYLVEMAILTPSNQEERRPHNRGRPYSSKGENEMEGIIIAVLSLLGTLGGSYFANKRSSALIAYRLEELEKKVDKHNSVVERTYGLEEAQAVLEEKIKVANHRIEDLENLENRA